VSCGAACAGRDTVGGVWCVVWCGVVCVVGCVWDARRSVWQPDHQLVLGLDLGGGKVTVERGQRRQENLRSPGTFALRFQFGWGTNKCKISFTQPAEGNHRCASLATSAA
jgi:hypothetical protein